MLFNSIKNYLIFVSFLCHALCPVQFDFNICQPTNKCFNITISSMSIKYFGFEMNLEHFHRDAVVRNSVLLHTKCNAMRVSNWKTFILHMSFGIALFNMQIDHECAQSQSQMMLNAISRYILCVCLVSTFQHGTFSRTF